MNTAIDRDDDAATLGPDLPLGRLRAGRATEPTHPPRDNAAGVVVAGAGLSGAVAAICLRKLGFPVVLLRPDGARTWSGAEAIPLAALPVFEALGLADLPRRAGAIRLDGFEVDWGGDEMVRPGEMLHVERRALADAALAEAKSCGTVIISCAGLPRPCEDGLGIRLEIDGRAHQFFFAIDATGRAARWSRPVRRAGRHVADLFLAAGGSSPHRGRVASITGGWAYRIGHHDSTTIGIVADSVRPRQIDGALLARLAMPVCRPQFLTRRPAFPQWAAVPLQGRRISIGDAALAYDPVAGGGIRFALSSAQAAASLIAAVREQPADRAAPAYYLELVESARRRHLKLIRAHYQKLNLPGWIPDHRAWAAESGPTRLRNEPDFDPIRLTAPDARVQFCGKVAPTAQRIDDRFVVDDAIVLNDDERVRWLGSLDLLVVRELTLHPQPIARLVAQLDRRGLNPDDALQALRWCIDRRLIGIISP